MIVIRHLPNKAAERIRTNVYAYIWYFGLGYLEALELSMQILLLGQLASVRTVNHRTMN
jgi:hypothetical protein